MAQAQTVQGRTANGQLVPIKVLSDGTVIVEVSNASEIGGSSGSALSEFVYVQKDTTSDPTNYKYYGYQKADGAWCVKRIHRTTNLATFAISGNQDPAVDPDTYTQAWTDRASLDYQSYGDAF